MTNVKLFFFFAPLYLLTLTFSIRFFPLYFLAHTLSVGLGGLYKCTVFILSAFYICCRLHFLSASYFVGVSTPADRLQTKLRVYGVQEPVAVATSMSIDASNADPWAEGVRYIHIGIDMSKKATMGILTYFSFYGSLDSFKHSIPKATPNSGELTLSIGVGHLPAVETIADNVYRHWLDANDEDSQPTGILH